LYVAGALIVAVGGEAPTVTWVVAVPDWDPLFTVSVAVYVPALAYA
jgi:hypothetical protein